MKKTKLAKKQREYSKNYYAENKEVILLGKKLSYAKKTKGQLGVYEVLQDIKRQNTLEVLDILTEKTNKKWTPEELKIVTDTMYTVNEVAKLTGRTPAAVASRRSVLLHTNNPILL